MLNTSTEYKPVFAGRFNPFAAAEEFLYKKPPRAKFVRCRFIHFGVQNEKRTD